MYTNYDTISQTAIFDLYMQITIYMSSNRARLFYLLDYGTFPGDVKNFEKKKKEKIFSGYRLENT